VVATEDIFNRSEVAEEPVLFAVTIGDEEKRGCRT
jgi:hypothetical protein